MVAGDLVNTASRIQSVADPGSVLVGEATMRSTDDVIAYESSGIFELKGKAEPVELWRAVAVVGLRKATGRSTVLEPPFTGRDREFRLIKELFHDSADNGKVHLVSVQGVGGIGKSRLVWELNKYIDGLVDDIWWHQGRCLAYGEGVAFWALAEMVRSRAGIIEDEESSSALPKLRASVEKHVADEAERRFVAPRLAHLLGLEERGSGDQENLFAACRIFFERIAEAGPSVMVFEDIHWADSALLDFIEYLVEWSRERPIFVADARATGARRPATCLGCRHEELHVHLPGAAPRGSDGLPSQRAGPRAPRRASHAHPRAGRGNPLLCGRDGTDADRPGASWSGRTGHTGWRGRRRSSKCPRRSKR